MLTPSFLGAAVPAGEHEVMFQFRNPGYQKMLLLCSVALWLILWLLWLRAGLKMRAEEQGR